MKIELVMPDGSKKIVEFVSSKEESTFLSIPLPYIEVDKRKKRESKSKFHK